MQVVELPAVADFHVHLRDGEMLKTVVPTVRQGGASLAYVMVMPPALIGSFAAPQMHGVSPS